MAQTKPVTRSRGGVQKYDTALWVVFSDKYIEESRELLSRADEIPQDGEGGDSMDALSFMDAEYLRKKWADGEDGQYTGVQVSKQYSSLGIRRSTHTFDTIEGLLPVSFSGVWRATIQETGWQSIIVRMELLTAKINQSFEGGGGPSL